ncbi:MAG: PD40 domain-containing protein [Anaerolineae bacterium]|nr:PD40 domain-containing protein [Anaerolineae bacterium]
MSWWRSYRNIVGLVCLLLAGCASGDGIAMTSIEADLPTKARSPSPIPVTGTPTATIEPTLTATEIPRSTPTLPPETGLPSVGPVLVFKAAGNSGGEEHLWAVSQDGTSPARLVDEPVLSFAVHPRSTLQKTIIAYVTPSKQGVSNIDLKLLVLPDGDVKTITPLVGEGFPIELSDVHHLIQAIRAGGLVWSPGGTLLAFVGMKDNAQVNLYTYDYNGGAIRRLSNQPYHALSPQWSPDGRFVIYRSTAISDTEGTQPEGLWASKYDGTGLVSLSGSAGRDIEGRYYTQVVAWLNNTELFLRNVRSSPSYALLANVDTGATSPAIDEPFDQAAYAPEYNTWLLTRIPEPGAEPSLLRYQYGERTEIPEADIKWVWWSDDHDMFFGTGDSRRLYTITPAGKLSEMPLEAGWYKQFDHEYRFSVSADGSWWAWHYPGGSGRGGAVWVGEPMKQPGHLVSAGTSTTELHLSWAPDSRRIICLVDAGLYKAEAPDFQIVPISSSVHAVPMSDWGGIWIR